MNEEMKPSPKTEPATGKVEEEGKQNFSAAMFREYFHIPSGITATPDARAKIEEFLLTLSKENVQRLNDIGLKTSTNPDDAEFVEPYARQFAKYCQEDEK